MSPERTARKPNLLMTLFLDVVYLVLAVLGLVVACFRGRFGRSLDHLRRRLFRAPPRREGEKRCLWIHGVSVGEIQTTRRLARRFAEELEGWEVVVSASTAEGVRQAQAAYEGHLVFSCPLDFSFAVRRAFRQIRPDALVIIEHDLWPNICRYAAGAGIAVVLLNATLSERSLRGYRRLSRFYPWPPRSLELVCAQDETSASRFRELGYPAERVEICGNLKFDNPAPEAAELRAEMGFDADDYVLVAGSTHEGEEDAALDAFEALRKKDERAFLIIAPRRMERVDTIEAMIEKRDLTVSRWSTTKTRGSDVILVDTVGDLAKLCAAGDLVFVGGTIAELGGHNVIEPAHFARPIVIGPHYKNQKSIVSTFLVDDALVVVPDAAGFFDAILELYENRARATEMGERAAAVVGKNQASGDATLAALRRLLLSD